MGEKQKAVVIRMQDDSVGVAVDGEYGWLECRQNFTDTQAAARWAERSGREVVTPRLVEELRDAAERADKRAAQAELSAEQWRLAHLGEVQARGQVGSGGRGCDVGGETEVEQDPLELKRRVEVLEAINSNIRDVVRSVVREECDAPGRDIEREDGVAAEQGLAEVRAVLGLDDFDGPAAIAAECRKFCELVESMIKERDTLRNDVAKLKAERDELLARSRRVEAEKPDGAEARDRGAEWRDVLLAAGFLVFTKVGLDGNYWVHVQCMNPARNACNASWRFPVSIFGTDECRASMQRLCPHVPHEQSSVLGRGAPDFTPSLADVALHAPPPPRGWFDSPMCDRYATAVEWAFKWAEAFLRERARRAL